MNTIETLWKARSLNLIKKASKRLEAFHSKKDFLGLITDSEIKYNVKAVDEELYNHYEELKKILNKKEDYLYFYNSYKNKFDDDRLTICILKILMTE